MRFRPFFTLLLALAALALFVAGCGGDDDDDEATEPVPTEAATGATGAVGGGAATSVSMTEFAFDPSDITVSQGDTIEATNDGQIPHNLTVEGEDLATEDLDGGGSEELTVDLQPGEYDFLCTIGDHAEQGMTGTLTVE